jgi:hypothetical protein
MQFSLYHRLCRCFSKFESRSFLRWASATAVSSVLYLSFLALNSSEFSTKNKVAYHFEANGRSIIAGQFAKTYRFGGQLPPSKLSRNMSDYIVIIHWPSSLHV